MAAERKTKYQRAVELAKSRGFSSPYAERKAKAQAKGFSSPRAEYTQRLKQRGRQRDYAAERERANIRAAGRGFRNANEQRKFNQELKRNPNLNREAWQKKRTLEYFGISEREFNRMRRENKLWAKEYPMLQWTAINTYDEYVDRDVHNWSEQRVGYIIYFNRAIVDPATNYDSLTKNGKRIITSKGKPKTNKSQYYYLVEYAQIMDIDEFESRYGTVTDG